MSPYRLVEDRALQFLRHALAGATPIRDATSAVDAYRRTRSPEVREHALETLRASALGSLADEPAVRGLLATLSPRELFDPGDVARACDFVTILVSARTWPLRQRLQDLDRQSGEARQALRDIVGERDGASRKSSRAAAKLAELTSEIERTEEASSAWPSVARIFGFSSERARKLAETAADAERQRYVRDLNAEIVIEASGRIAARKSLIAVLSKETELYLDVLAALDRRPHILDTVLRDVDMSRVVEGGENRELAPETLRRVVLLAEAGADLPEEDIRLLETFSEGDFEASEIGEPEPAQLRM